MGPILSLVIYALLACCRILSAASSPIETKVYGITGDADQVLRELSRANTATLCGSAAPCDEDVNDVTSGKSNVDRRDTMLLYVTDVALNQVWTLTSSSDDTIASIKTELQDQSGINAVQQILVYHGTVLADGLTLASYLDADYQTNGTYSARAVDVQVQLFRTTDDS
ncbi:hypothetical protein PsYK624_043440 [Phanerochaete sordida]|uniref:Ubiquitin-like domain-containing protein n=1 Tax=Phanerochaete sordida TaxID=48140 RepID=A0A9P3G4T5_9APHY|nr:hypothetical protein PsYK624_043440 [Phanerochaete sordida]